ncbi:MAG: hypothetical protein LH660_05260 [Phormidesmis sp. CAN_BIN36]|nr:hypothetical protein [Phormidesmis sp. CAN_BIN36]
MQAAFKVTTKVLPGNKIEIQLPSGSEGDEVDVIIVLPGKVLPEKSSSQRRNVMEIIEEARPNRIGMTAEQIDAYLQEERASWDS